MTLEEIQKKLYKEKKLLDTIKQEIVICEAKISIYEEMIIEIEGAKKELTEDELIAVEKDTIKENPEMQRVTLIAANLRKKGFEFDGDLLARKLVKTGKFKQNADSKFWEIIKY
jgi:hypothetical protein